MSELIRGSRLYARLAALQFGDAAPYRNCATQRWVSLNSMRRLRLKAAIVLPRSIGWNSPNPVAASRVAGTPRSIRYLTTAIARPVESSQFDG